MIWPFKKTPKIGDWRVWNDDWSVGDVAESVTEQGDWMAPWSAPQKGQRLHVTAVYESVGLNKHGERAKGYFLRFAGYKCGYNTSGFRKVKPLKKAEETEVGAKILKAKPAPDINRDKPAKVSS